jgi:hypothetical protein
LLRLVAREAPRHEGSAQFNRHADQVNGLKLIGSAGFINRTHIGSRRILSFGQAVATIVHYNISHIQIAPNRVDELPHANRSRVAVARNAEVRQMAVC